MDAVPNQRTRPPRIRPDAPVDVSLGAGPLLVAVVALAIPLMVPATVVVVVLPAIPWWVGPPVGLIVAAGVLWHRLQQAHTVVAGRLVEHTPTVTSVRLSNMVRGLALAAGVEEPEALVLRDDAMNAAVLSRNGSATIAISSGLLDTLEPVELEGVVAELLVRLRSGDAEAATLAAAVFRLPVLGPLSALLTGPAASLGVDRLLDEGRDVLADIEAVALTRYPPGLLRALTKARSGDHRVNGVDPALDELWLINPTDNAVQHSRAIRSALDLRIDVLTEL